MLFVASLFMCCSLLVGRCLSFARFLAVFVGCCLLYLYDGRCVLAAGWYVGGVWLIYGGVFVCRVSLLVSLVRRCPPLLSVVNVCCCPLLLL